MSAWTLSTPRGNKQTHLTPLPCMASLFKRLKNLCTTDRAFLERQYRRRLGLELDLDDPVTMNEKLQWLKCFYRDPLMTQAADKVLARELVAELATSEVLNDEIAVFRDAREVDLLRLPEQFVLRPNNGSGGNVICRSRARREFICDGVPTEDWSQCVSSLQKHLGENYYWRAREWCYKDIAPRLLCEAYMQNDDGALPDFKVHCFNGTPRAIHVDTARFSGHRRDYFDRSWSHLPFTSNYPMSSTPPPAPACLEKILHLAELLAKPFPFARVDFYEVSRRPIFGEITFYPEAGYQKFQPDHGEIDAQLGGWLTLPRQAS